MKREIILTSNDTIDHPAKINQVNMKHNSAQTLKLFWWVFLAKTEKPSLVLFSFFCLFLFKSIEKKTPIEVA